MHRKISLVSSIQISFNFLCTGLEEFEEKIDRISENKGTKDSWLTKIFNQFSQKYEKVI